MKKFVIIFVGFIALALLHTSVEAVQVILKNNLNLETSTVEQTTNFALPESIYVVPIEQEVSAFVSDLAWYEGIYYYNTFKLNQGDIQFHYIIGSDGTVYEGNSYGVDQRINILDDTESPIIIGYLAKNNELDFSENAKEVLFELLLEQVNLNNINPASIKSKRAEFIAVADSAVAVKFFDTSGRWERSINDIIKLITPKFSPTEKNYSFDVLEVILPTEPVNYGENIVGEIKIKNTSENTYYYPMLADPIVSKINEGISKFYINDIWLSTTQTPLSLDNAILKPNEEATFSFRIGVPLYFGKQTETFQLTNKIGKVYDNTEFDITLEINKPEGREVVEILPTETGQLNVRSSASGSSQVIGTVSPEQRFFVLERTTSGWVKIEIDSQKSGWVAAKYIKNL